MINVTESAQKELSAYFADREVQPVRIHLADGGCSGPRLSLALDEVRDGDKSFEHGDISFLINEELMTTTGAVTVDMSDYGFVVESENQVGGGGGCGCASGGGCGSGSGGCGC